MKKAISAILTAIILLGVVTVFAGSASAADSVLPTPYKTVVLKSANKDRYVYVSLETHDRLKLKSGKEGDGVSTFNMSFQWVPCPDEHDASKKHYALRSEALDKFISCKKALIEYVDYIDYVDFIEQASLFDTVDAGDGKLLKFIEKNVYFSVDSNGDVIPTTDVSKAEKFTIKTISKNEYTKEEKALLQSSEWFNLNGKGVGYYDIQYEIGQGKTDALSKLGYALMHLKGRGENVIEIDNLQCAIGVMFINNKYEVLITIQGTGGYSSAGENGDLSADIASNLDGGSFSDNDGMHKGYHKMSDKLKNNEKKIVGLANDSFKLSDLISLAKQNKAHFTILGHSMGGAIAQCYAIHLNEECGVAATAITGRTFNSAIATDKYRWGYDKWYNLCVSTDSVCNGLVPGALTVKDRLGKTIWLYDDEPNKNLEKGTGEFFSNIVKNKHNMDTLIRSILDKAVGHNYVVETKKATPDADGKKAEKCRICGAGGKTIEVYYKANQIKLSSQTLVFNNAVQKPTLSVKNSKGSAISSRNYTVKWSNAKSKAIGTYTVTITLKGDYEGTKILKYKIVPQQVTGLQTSSISSTAISLTWTAVPGVKYYLVEKSTDGKKWTKVEVVSKNSVKATGLKAGTTYQFRVKALDDTKKIAGAESTVLKAQTAVAAPKITTLTSTASKSAVVKWTAVNGAKSYTVYKSADNKNWTKVKTGIKKTSCTLTGLSAGKKIYVKVVAVNALGENSAASAVKSVTVKKLTNAEAKKRYEQADSVATDWLQYRLGCEYMSYDSSIYVSGHGTVYLVEHKTINSVAKLKKYLSNFFTKNIYEEYVDEHYWDINGKLYFGGNFGAGGDPRMHELQSVTVLSQSENTAKLKLRVGIWAWYDGEDHLVDTETDTLKMKYSKGRWIFKDFFRMILDGAECGYRSARYAGEKNLKTKTASAADNDKYLSYYADVINSYKSLIIKNFDYDEVTSHPKKYKYINDLCCGRVYYSLTDINKDGVPELLIADQSIFYGVYTYYNGKIVPFKNSLSWGYRARGEVLPSGIIVDHGSINFAEYGWSFYQIKKGGKKPVLVDEILFSYDKYYRGDSNGKEITREQAERIMKKYTGKDDFEIPATRKNFKWTLLNQKALTKTSVAIERGKTYARYDLTGNGVPDELSCSYTNYDNDVMVYINDRYISTIAIGRQNSISVFAPAKDKCFIIAHNHPFKASEDEFYIYKKGKLQKVSDDLLLSNKPLDYIEDYKKVDDNTFSAVMRAGSHEGTIFSHDDDAWYTTKALAFKFLFKMSATKVKPASRYGDAVKPVKYRANKDFWACKSPTSQNAAYKIKKGESIKITQLYVKTNPQTAYTIACFKATVTTSGGKTYTCWINLDKVGVSYDYSSPLMR